MQKQRGFSAVEGILVLIILALIGFGWYAFQAKKRAENESAKPTPTPQATTNETPRPDIPADWTWYDNDELKLALAHPKTWTISATQPETCPFDAKLYGSTACPLTVKLSPRDYTEDERNSPDSSLVAVTVYKGDQLMAEANALAYELGQVAAAKATIERQESYQVNTLNAFYVRSVATGITDNIWTLKFPDFYLRFANRERNTAYYSNGKASFTTDYARYTTTLERVVRSAIALNK